MTAKTRAQLETVFQQGDIPQQSDYIDVFDSFVNLVDTTAQTITSPLNISGSVTVSGDLSVSGNFNMGGTLTLNVVSAQVINTSVANVLGTLNANLVSAQNVNTSALTVRADATVSGNATIGGTLNANIVSAQRVVASSMNIIATASVGGNLQVNKDLSVSGAATIGQTLSADIVSAQRVVASSMNVIATASCGQLQANEVQASGALFTKVSAGINVASVDSSVKTVGSAQALAKVITAEKNLIVAASAGDDGILVSARFPGRSFHIYNATGTNIKLYPEVGGTINTLAGNAAYIVSGSVGVIMDVITSTRYAVF